MVASLQRKSVAAIATSVDRAIGRVVESLKTARMYQNSLIVLSTDNGGPTDGADNNNMNNFPLRGCVCSVTDDLMLKGELTASNQCIHRAILDSLHKCGAGQVKVAILKVVSAALVSFTA